MKEFIEFIAKNLVDEPDSVRVDETMENKKVTLKLHVSKSDLGKVIGKQGKTAKSMRTLLTAVAAKHNMSGQLEIDEGEDEHRHHGNGQEQDLTGKV
jgi:predicted RNA-binding protein YlqC (UPF0109 family)